MNKKEKTHTKGHLEAGASVKKPPKVKLVEDDPLWSLVGSACSGLTDGAENHDKYLYGWDKGD